MFIEPPAKNIFYPMKAHGQAGVTFIDIRDPRELWRDGTIPGAINVTRGMPPRRRVW